MDTLEAIRTRRSIGQYRDKRAPQDLLRQVLASAMYAPHACKQQPWQFMVIPERRKIPVRSPFPPVPRKPLLQLLIGLCFASPLAAETLLVHNGQPGAAIVVAQSPPRTVRLAAQELQDCVENITGAHLPIVTQPGRAGTVPIYVRRSEHTDRLRITAEGSQGGAYRIVSGDGWLVLIGQDTEFTPIEPWAIKETET